MRDRALERFEELFGPEFGHGKAFDLAQLRYALAELGNPQDKLPRIIHVAGTNGKGSTIAFMRAIAEAAGLRVHAFTKPHLFCLNERFLVASNPIDDDALIAAAERVAQIAPDLTQFDAQVATAFLLFGETPADLTLIETGMGGFDDSTNVIIAPAASVITPIGLDHQDALGATLKEIAAHKAGILKRDVAVHVEHVRSARDMRVALRRGAEPIEHHEYVALRARTARSKFADRFYFAVRDGCTAQQRLEAERRAALPLRQAETAP